MAYDFYLGICHGFAAQAIPDEFRFLVLGISPLPACSTGGNRDDRDDRFGTPCGCRLIHDISGNWMQQLLLDVTRGCGFYFGAVSLVSFKLVGDRNETLDLLAACSELNR